MIRAMPELLVVAMLFACGGAPFAGVGEGSSGAGAGGAAGLAGGGSSGAGAGGAAGLAGAGGGGSSGASAGGAAGLAGAAGGGSSGAGAGGAAGLAGAAGGGGSGSCLESWRGSTCDACSSEPPPTSGRTCAVILDCYQAEACGPSSCTPDCEYGAPGASDHTVQVARAVFACLCP